MGDPSGIGPEVALKALASPEVSRLASFVLIGDARVIERNARDMRLKANVPVIDLADVRMAGFAYGRCERAYGRASMEYVDMALAILKNGRADALVTAPINKSAVRSSGLSRFEGHTEYIAAASGAKDYVMMFIGQRLKVSLVTRHIALNNVARALNAGNIYTAIAVTHRSLKNLFKIKNPRIGVAGLNPHAGEAGLFGREEEKIIAPAVRKAAKKIKGISGPVPPDVIFHEALAGRYDAVISMYHDQGLIPFKMLYFETGVNLTLGLPFIRTSPDHGTAFNVAGKGMADPSSMKEALKLAARLAKNLKSTKR